MSHLAADEQSSSTPQKRGLPPQAKDDFRRLFSLLSRHRRRIFVAFLTITAQSLLLLAVPLMLGNLIDAIAPGEDSWQLTRGAIILLAIFAARSTIQVASTYLLAYIGERVTADLRIRLNEHLQNLSIGYFGKRRTGELMSRLTNDVNMVRQLIIETAETALARGLLFIGPLVMILAIDWRLTLLMLALIPVLALGASAFGRRLRSLSFNVQERLAQATTALEESIGGVRVVKAFQRQAYESRRYAGHIEETFDFSMAVARLNALFRPLITFLFSCAVVLIFWYGGKEVLAGRLSSGRLMSFVILTLTLAVSVSDFGNLWVRLNQAAGASRRLFELLETRMEVGEAADARTLGPVQGRLVFDHVSFTYESTDSESFTLRDLSFELEPGEILALVGPSGAGKTTLINLIPRFYDPTAGSIYLDDIDQRAITLNSLRDQIGIVPQETYLFGGSIRENLLYGRLEATEQEMVQAAQAANAEDFIRQLSQGYDTLVGERGLRLSVGQRQRLAIARALLKDPRILILDEATSALDSESESLVQEALERLMANRTSIVIAHRLSTVRNAHRIAALDGGRLVELGTHEELLAADGLYAKLYRLQFLGERPTDDIPPTQRPGGGATRSPMLPRPSRPVGD